MDNVIKSLVRPIKEQEKETVTGEESDTTLILWNDEVNTIDWVIESLIDVCHHSTTQAEQCALIAHYNGKSDVKTGSEEELKPMKKGLTERGLRVTLEKAKA